MSIKKSIKSSKTHGAPAVSKAISKSKNNIASRSKKVAVLAKDLAPLAQASQSTAGADAIATRNGATTKPISKHDLIINLLQDQGSSIAELIKVTGWQAHSIRGFISGTIKKKLGLPLTSQKQDGALIYRITKL